MRFFKPNRSVEKPSNTKFTGANIRQEQEDRMKMVKEKRNERRDKVMRGTEGEKTGFMKELEARREGTSRLEFNRQERKEQYRMGIQRNENKKEKPR